MEERLRENGPGFPVTAWSVVRGAQAPDLAERDRALDRLISVYWRPVYWSLRLDWSCAPEQARDLTQEYFSVFLEKSMVNHAQQESGRFRGYVKVTLKRFMLSQRRAEGALKRGGEHEILALDDLDLVEADVTAVQESPERRFERELMESILQRALEDLGERCEREGKTPAYSMFREYYLDQAGDARLTYEDLAQRFGLGPHEVKNRLAELRARFRKHVMGYLRDGVSTDEELVAEIREVFQQ